MDRRFRAKSSVANRKPMRIVLALVGWLLSEWESLPLQAVSLRSRAPLVEPLWACLASAKSRVRRGREQLRAIALGCRHVETDGDGLACEQKPDGARYC